MQQMKAGQESNGRTERHPTHRRLERWIRLQQFVYGLPDDFSYAVCLSEKAGVNEGRALVSVGWMSWYGQGTGADPQHALAVSLLESSETLSANSRAAFFHRIRRSIRACVSYLKPAGARRPGKDSVQEESNLLAS